MNQQELMKIAETPSRYRSAYVNRIRRFYCPAIVSLGRCIKPCSENILCKVNIRKAVAFDDARDPVAVLVWQIRDITSKLKEQELETPQVITDWTGDAVNKNPFEMLLEEL